MFANTFFLKKIEILLYIITCFGLSCSEKSPEPLLNDNTPYILTIPDGFPIPDIPENNLLTETRIQLGKKLFYDPILSRDSTISCASCHLQSYAFTDQQAISIGIDNKLGFRNAPSLANVAYHNSFLKDGGVPTLALQVIVPIEDENEMDFSIVAAVNRLQNNKTYRELIRQAYNSEPSPFTLSRAIAAFERTLISGNSRFDRYFYQNDSLALSSSEIEGMLVFFSTKAQCTYCHSGFNFTNNAFENNGLYESYTDIGRKRITQVNSDEGKFKVPSLRNIAVTAPYMHNGSLATLDAVLDHYANKGSNHPNKSPLINNIALNKEEKEGIILFLHSLTDSTFLNNPKHKR